MTRHWKPEGKPAAARARKHWPQGATVGLALIAAACLGVAVALYHVAGPSDVFEETE